IPGRWRTARDGARPTPRPRAGTGPTAPWDRGTRVPPVATGPAWATGRRRTTTGRAGARRCRSRQPPLVRDARPGAGGVAASGHARVVHHRVEPSVLLHDGVDDTRDRGLVLHVGHVEAGALPPRGALEVEPDDDRTLVDEPQRGRLAQSGRGAGDECDLAGQ